MALGDFMPRRAARLRDVAQPGGAEEGRVLPDRPGTVSAGRPDALWRHGCSRDREMNAHAARHGPPPDVDEGEAHDLTALLRRELRPTPGRLGDSVRIVIVVLAAVAIAETFRIPEIAVSAYIEI